MWSAQLLLHSNRPDSDHRITRHPQCNPCLCNAGDSLLHHLKPSQWCMDQSTHCEYDASPVLNLLHASGVSLYIVPASRSTRGSCSGVLFAHTFALLHSPQFPYATGR